MTVVVSDSLIKINNSFGVEKFNSNNKLLYQRLYRNQEVFVGPNSVSFVGLETLQPQDILVLTIKILSTSGQADLNSALINREIPVSGPILVDFFGRNVSNQAAVDSEALCIDSINNTLRFSTYRRNNYGDIIPGQTSIYLRYTARIWSFL